MPPFRSDQFQIHLTVAGVALDNVSWDSFEGADLKPNMEKYPPGGMAPEQAVGGRRSRSDATLTRAWSPAMMGVYLALEAASGIAAVSMSIVPIYADRVTAAVNGGFPYTGVLGDVTKPKNDAATSSIAYLTVVCSMNE